MHTERNEPLIHDRNLAQEMAISSDKNRTIAASIRRSPYMWGNRNADEFDHFADMAENAAGKSYVNSLYDQLRIVEGKKNPADDTYLFDPEFTSFVSGKIHEILANDQPHSPEEVRLIVDVLVKKSVVSEEVLGEIISYLVASNDQVLCRSIVSEAQGINSAIVSKAVSALVSTELVVEEKQVSAGAGRPFKKLTVTDDLVKLVGTYEPWAVELRVRQIAEKVNMPNKECKNFIVQAGSIALLGAATAATPPDDKE